MRIKRKKKKKKNKSTKKVVTTHTSVKNPLVEQQEKIATEELKHSLSKKKIHNFFDSATDIIIGFGKILFLIILGCGTIGIIVFLIWAMYAYFHNQGGVATITMTIMQALSGLVSVIVGVWALILAIQSERKQIATENKLNINRTSSGSDVVGVLDSEDVDPDSL